jgi:hypothetical protein
MMLCQCRASKVALHFISTSISTSINKVLVLALVLVLVLVLNPKP